MNTSFLFDLSRGEHKELDLTAQGVPADATILRLSFTSQGGDCFAQVKHGNLATARFVGPKVYIYGMPHDMGVAGGKTCASVTWIRERDSADSWLYLVDAFEAMAARKYWHVILPAHIGFEVALIPLVRDALEKHVSKERVKDFLDNGLSISVALNIVLPLLCEISHAPRLRDEIRGQLNHLRELRNQLVHEGLPKESITEQLAAEMLAASMFGFEYVQFLRTRI